MRTRKMREGYKRMRGVDKRRGFLWRLFEGAKNIVSGGCKKHSIEIGYAIFLVLVTCFGILLDSAYWGRCSLLSGIVDCLKSLRAFGISYTRALEILQSNVGVLMTMVSIFLTMGINVAERSEKKIYGMYRKELLPSDKYKEGLRWICYTAPIIMIICLNLSYCVCGYLLIFYCYLFLIIRYHEHEKSYDRVLIRDAMVRKILEYLPRDRNWDWLVLSNYRMILENIGRSVQEEGNWQEITELYDNLILNINAYDTVEKYKIAYFIERDVYWTDNEKGRIEAVEHLFAQIKRIAQETSDDEKIMQQHRPVLWAILKAAISEAKEEELVDFFQWLLDIPAWSRQVIWQSGKESSLNIFKEETGVIMLFLEYRFRNEPFEEIQLRQQVKDLWNYAKDFFASENSQEICCFYTNLLEEGEGEFKNCLDDLQSDFNNGTKRSLISNILIWGRE